MLRTHRIQFEFNDRPILADVSVDFFSGGLHFLIGLNGSGKTTLLKCLLGLLRYRGEVWLSDRPIARYTPSERARHVAWVPQRLEGPMYQRVYDFVLMGRFPYLSWLGNYQARDHAAVRKAIRRLELESFRNRRLDQLSGGELQRVSMARALAQDTPVLLLDEPTQSLDPLHKAQVYNLLHELAGEGRTIVCTTHDIEPLTVAAVHLVGLRAGRVVLDTTRAMGREALMETVYQMSATTTQKSS